MRQIIRKKKTRKTGKTRKTLGNKNGEWVFSPTQARKTPSSNKKKKKGKKTGLHGGKKKKKNPKKTSGKTTNQAEKSMEGNRDWGNWGVRGQEKDEFDGSGDQRVQNTRNRPHGEKKKNRTLGGEEAREEGIGGAEKPQKKERKDGCWGWRERSTSE